MAKILRLHATGSSTHEGWGPTTKLNHAEIDQILDPQGGRAASVAVSIPSPFARMHLVETAFQFVDAATRKNGATDTVYHQLLTHYWDVWEVVFNYFQQRQATARLSVRTWHRDAELATLTNGSPRNAELAKVLRLYLQDPRFRDFTELHLLYFPGRDGQPQLIGGTSPLTLFFPAPNLKPLALQRPHGSGHYFDAAYVPLTAREPAFQEYIYQLFTAAPPTGEKSVGTLAPAVREALESTLRGRVLQGAIDLSQYPVLMAANNPVVVAGVPVRVRPDENTVTSSDLLIRPSRATAPLPLPLVLRPAQKEPTRKYYNNTPFGESGAKVPVRDPRPLKDRTLPGPELAYPYLTVDDLLTDTLLAVPYVVDKERFHCGTVTIARDAPQKFWPLLPLRPAYFDYFTPDDLETHLSMDVSPAGVRVKLRIPVAGGGTVDYERAYVDNPQADGYGRLRITNVGLAFFPLLKVVDAPQYNDYYKVMLVDANVLDPTVAGRDKTVKLHFYVDGRVLTPHGTEQRATRYDRTPKGQRQEGTAYYEITGTPFDYLEIENPEPAIGRALVVPRWIEKTQGSREFRFAIDFGTTNTHVAYHAAPNEPPQPFAFGVDDSPVTLLKKATDEPERGLYERLFRGIDEDGRFVAIRRWQLYQQREFVPPLLGGKDSPYQFPIRTATSESATFENEPPNLLDNINIGFGLNTEEDDAGYHTNLKWDASAGDAGKARVRAFFRELLLLFRYKAAMNGGRLEATRIVWFAPLSFSAFDLNRYQSEWDSLSRQIFRTTRATTYLPESTAPFYFLTRRGIIAPGPGENAVFIDVGGGTTDVLVYADRQPVLSTSFRFAGNDLWGDGAAEVGGSQDNGLVRYGIAAFEAAPRPTGERAALAEKNLTVVRNSRRDRKAGSEELASLLFNYDDVFRFSDRLLDAKQLRVVFYLHFGAIVYHVGQVMALRGYQPPRYLCFTGRGSLYVRLLAGGANLAPVEALAKQILRNVMAAEVPANFRIVLAEDPKQTTANGGVLATQADGAGRPPGPPVGRAMGTGASGADETRDVYLPDVSDALKQAVLANVQQCLHLLLANPEVTRLQDSLGVKNPPGHVLSLLEPLLADSFNMSRDNYAVVLPKGEPIPETLFFLAFKNALYELSKALHGGHSPSYAA
ncbi:MAG: hypothetical protein H7330_15995 [Hymenobacteraceae bacterium]|nr:hypothetical protein [Hymenobacteraceae bacterium]